MIVLITAVTAGICVLCLYSIYGNVIRHETTLHDLRCRVELLHNQQLLHLAEIKGEITPEIVQSEETESMGLELTDAPQTEDVQSDEELVSSSTKAA